MGKTTIEERGRIVLPKKIRDELHLKAGQEVVIQKTDDGIMIRPAIDVERLSEKLKGCIKKSKIKAQDIKHIWHM